MNTPTKPSAQPHEHTLEGHVVARHIQGSNFAVQEFQFRAGTYPIFQESLGAIKCGSVYCSPKDAAFIAEAFNVSTETGLSPRQLADTNKELLEVLKEALPVLEDSPHARGYTPTFLVKVRAAIARAEKRA